MNFRNIEKEIQNRVNSTGNLRLDVIANMNLGKRSEAAYRASQKRERRKELIKNGMSFEIACIVVNKENE